LAVSNKEKHGTLAGATSATEASPTKQQQQQVGSQDFLLPAACSCVLQFNNQ
jgi:hypothetical protein